ncbi:MAG: sodium-dependent bicarbonate transport family permease [Ignavibacteria bacterium]|nr:sodium-dependent bicarbonate transport family permease [Ignavibacteria bacterium]
MIENLLDPVILFFAMGLLAGLLKSDLRLPEAIYEVISIFLLMAIGLKGGVQLAKTNIALILLPVGVTVLLGLSIPLIAYPILRKLGKFNEADSAAIAAHYGSVSAVTFAVVQTYLERLLVAYEEYVTVLLVVLEIPAIAMGILIARMKTRKHTIDYGLLFHEVFLGKSIYLLIAGLLVGWAAGPERIEPVAPLFFDLFKAALAFFLLEMGLVAARRISDLRRVGLFLIGFGILMPIVSAVIGTLFGYLAGLSLGGSVVLATLSASASYIAAPAAMRIAVPQANPTLYLTASLGITFPFNLLFGIPLYHWMGAILYSMGG